MQQANRAIRTFQYMIVRTLRRQYTGTYGRVSRHVCCALCMIPLAHNVSV